MKPKISIIIPIYNSEKYLEKCIESVINQSFNEFELLLINDGSSDKTREICELYVNKDNRIKLFNLENGGVSNARNFGIDSSNSEYICFIDSDDYIKLDMLYNLYRATENGKIDLVVSGMFFERYDGGSWNNIIDNYKATNYKELQFIIRELFKSYLLYNPVGKLYKAIIINKNNLRFKKDMSFGEDPVFNCEYLKKISSCININESYYIYVKHGETSLSNKFESGKIEFNEKMHHELELLLVNYSVLDNETKEVINSRYSKELIDMIFTINRAKDNVSFSEKRRFLKKIFANDKYEFQQEYLKDVNMALKICIKFKFELGILIYFKLRKILINS